MREISHPQEYRRKGIGHIYNDNIVIKNSSIYFCDMARELEWGKAKVIQSSNSKKIIEMQNVLQET